MRNTDFDLPKASLQNADWIQVHEADDPNEVYAAFLSTWNEVIDIHCPKKEVCFRHRPKPWLTMSPELMDLKARRDTARARWKATGEEGDTRAYVDLKKQFRSQLERAKAEFFAAPSAPKDMWKNLKAHILGPSKDESNKQLTPGMAERFNDFFAEIGKRTADQLAAAGQAGELQPRPPTVVSTGFRVRPATEAELKSALFRMSSSKAVGCDEVSLQLIRRCFAEMAPHVLQVINRSIITGIVPTLWKCATVVPIFKQGDASLPNSYRPISILSSIGKLAEKVVCTQLTEYIEKPDIMSTSQYAYRPGHCTEDAVVDVISVISANRDNGKLTCLTSSDLSKAFDCIDRKRLLSKLQWYGVSTHWLESYFEGRTQMVRGSDKLRNVDYGEVQGSVLGPVLFNLFTNDLQCHLSEKCHVVRYADDTVLEHRGNPTSEGLEEMKKVVETDLAALARWFKTNGLKANPEKTELIIVGAPATLKKAADFSVTFDGVNLKPTETMKYLGITMDKCLTMEAQTSNVLQKCYGGLITLKKISTSLPNKTVLRLVQSLVMPHINYCLPAWAPPTQALRHRVDKAINFAARVITGKRKFERISNIREELGLDKFDFVIQQRDCAYVHKAIYNDRAPENSKKLMTLRADAQVRPTRATVDTTLEIQRCRLEATKRTAPARLIATWNGLPNTLRAVTQPKMFTRELRKHHARLEQE